MLIFSGWASMRYYLLLLTGLPAGNFMFAFSCVTERDDLSIRNWYELIGAPRHGDLSGLTCTARKGGCRADQLLVWIRKSFL